MILDVYNRFNIIGNGIGFPEYWKEEIQLIESFNPAYPWRHDLDELTNGDYIRVFGTQLLIQRLFLKAFKTDDDWTAISNILNYSEVLDATERQKVFNYLKDPSKTNQEAWELYQASGVVASYRFDQPLSLYNEDGSLCKLGWEGENLIVSNCVNADYTTFANGTPTGFDVTSNGSSVQEAETADEIEMIAGVNYLVKFTIVLNSGTAPSVRLSTSLTGGTNSIVKIATNGENSFIFTALTTATGVVRFINESTTTNYEITNLSAKQIGDTVAKVLDVGSGGADGLTYLNLLQSDMSLQFIRIAEGIDSVDDTHEMDVSATLNGKTATITKLDDTTATFVIADAKITGKNINDTISSYKCKSITVAT